MRTSRVLLFCLVLSAWILAGCDPTGGLASFGGLGGGHPVLKKANETAALSWLKRYSAAQAILHTEQMRYSHDLRELCGGGPYGGILDARLLSASGDSPRPTPLSGYLFSQIMEGDYGGILDSHRRCGLAAYPARPGRSGDRVLLILLDEAWWDTSGQVSGGNWRLFWAEAGKVRGPVTRWPSDLEMRTTWREIRRRTPEEGLREAQGLMDDFHSGRPVKDPVFGDKIR